jgi:hypothetical protein
MVALGIPSQTRDSYISTLRVCAIAISAVSGICAVVALAVGSPLEFGVAMALCAGWLIAADFIESSAEGQRAARQLAVPSAQFKRASEPYRVVFAGGEPSARPPRRRTATR